MDRQASMTAAQDAKTKKMDPRPFIMAAYKKYGQLGAAMAMERILVSYASDRLAEA